MRGPRDEPQCRKQEAPPIAHAGHQVARLSQCVNRQPTHSLVLFEAGQVPLLVLLLVPVLEVLINTPRCRHVAAVVNVLAHLC